jgi:signal transduction histidine kinase
LQSTVPNGTPYPPFGFFPGVMQSEWPWRIGRLSLGALAVELLAAGGGMVLIAYAVRVQAGLAGPPRSAWHALTGQRRRSGRVASRAIPGIGLIAVAAFLGITLATRYVAGHELLETVAVLGIAGSATVLVASPLAVGLLMRTDLDKAGRAREEERRRFAAHLHDSVLQTLALIQRQAHDPAAVTKLARRQEHALRAWMAGEADLVSATVATAVREMVAEVEDEEGVTVELTSIGADRGLDSKDEELIAAGREALRNAARHAPGASIFVFLDIDRERTEMFIRDDGPGFDPGAVAAERRGLRDAVLGRMRFVGGLAVVDSAPGQGTEIALRLPHNGRVR